MKAMLGRKLGMTQVFKDDKLIPVTKVQLGPCSVTQIKLADKGNAYQIGYLDLKPVKVKKPMKGHFDKSKVTPKKYLAEFISENAFELGQTFSCDIFAEGDKTTVTAVSKGKGFQGVMKRHNFSGGPGGHGSHFHRTPGSVGMAATPSRVLKGTKMAGQMGSEKVTVKNLEVVEIDVDNNTVSLKGAVPGGKGTLVMVRSLNEIAEPEPEPETRDESSETSEQDVKQEGKNEKVKEDLKEAEQVEQTEQKEEKTEKEPVEAGAKEEKAVEEVKEEVTEQNQEEKTEETKEPKVEEKKEEENKPSEDTKKEEDQAEEKPEEEKKEKVKEEVKTEVATPAARNDEEKKEKEKEEKKEKAPEKGDEK